METNLVTQLGNLHDVLMNASLQACRMNKEPIADDPETFMISDRGRFERTWLAFLYVLVECWRSQQMREVRDFIQTKIPDCQIVQLLREGEKNGAIKALREVRDYMCHRDRRTYWDTGRLAVAGNFDFNMRLHAEFSRVLYAAMDVVRNQQQK